MVLEGSDSLVDWGLKDTRKTKAEKSLKQIARLIAHYEPTVLVLEDATHESCRRRPRIRVLLQQARDLAAAKNITSFPISRRLMQAAFIPHRARNKEHIADLLVSRFPELATRRPPVRKPWMSEADRMSIFDAAALAVTFFELQQEEPVESRIPRHLS